MAGPESAPRREALQADAALVGVTALWGSTFVVNRLVLDSAPPLQFLILRFVAAAALLVALAWRRARTPGLMRDGALIGGLLALGIGCQIVGQLFTTASKAAFVTGLSVPLTPVVGYLVLKRKPSAENLAGLVVASIGFAVLSWPTGAAGVNTGDLLILGTALAYAFIISHMGESAGRHDVRWYSAFQIGFAALGVSAGRLALQPFLHRPGTLFAAEARPIPRTFGMLAALLWMSLLATVLTFIAQTWAQARMPATHAAILFALEPVWAAIFAALVLSERLSRRDWIGAGLVLLGILVSELPLGRR